MNSNDIIFSHSLKNSDEIIITKHNNKHKLTKLNDCVNKLSKKYSFMKERICQDDCDFIDNDIDNVTLKIMSLLTNIDNLIMQNGKIRVQNNLCI